MKLRISGLIVAFALAGILGSAQSLAQNAYITNRDTNNVSVIDTGTNTIIATIPVDSPFGVAVAPDGSKAYVTNGGSSTVSAIDTATNTVTATITVDQAPTGVAITPDGNTVYVAKPHSSTISVIATATNTIIATIPVQGGAYGVAAAQMVAGSMSHSKQCQASSR